VTGIITPYSGEISFWRQVNVMISNEKEILMANTEIKYFGQAVSYI
jgi:hypothetical protein